MSWRYRVNSSSSQGTSFWTVLLLGTSSSKMADWQYLDLLLLTGLSLTRFG